MNSNNKIFFPNLDGWRFIAFLAVFYHHSLSTKFEHILADPFHKFLRRTAENGNLGVDFFFVLSGFLIIYLLISEKKLTGKINVKNFYIRRILRIFPLYYFCVCFGFILFPLLKNLLNVPANENANLLNYLLFLSNIDIINNHAIPDASMLGVLWSVSIEEQFYLTIPFLLLIVPMKFYKWIFGIVLILSWVFRANYVEDYFAMTFHTFAFVGNLAIGGLIAFYSITNKRFVEFFQNLNSHIIKLIYLIVVIIFFFKNQIFFSPILKVFETSIIAVFFALMILEQNFSNNSFYKMKNNYIFSILGKYTYGMYCLHMVAILIILQISSRLHTNTELWQLVLIETPLSLALSILIAYLSYQYYEKPFLKLKDRFSVISKN